MDGAPRYPAPPSPGLAAGRSQRLTRGPCHITALCWSPDGRRLAFAHQPHPSADQMYAAGCRWSPPPGQDAGAAAGPGAFTSLAWSPDGPALAGLPPGHGLAGEKLQLRSGEARLARCGAWLPTPSRTTGARASLAWGPATAKSLPAGGSGAQQHTPVPGAPEQAGRNKLTRGLPRSMAPSAPRGRLAFPAPRTGPTRPGVYQRAWRPLPPPTHPAAPQLGRHWLARQGAGALSQTAPR